MSSCLRCGFVAALALAVRAQDLSLDALLPRIQHHVAEFVFGLPNYTCLETVHRFERPRRVKDFQPIDTIKLEIAVLNGAERFAWPGSSQFEDKDLLDLLGGGRGALTKGDFVMHARNIFLLDKAVFSSPRAEKLGDRSAIRLDYQVPEAKSNFEIRTDGQKAVVGYKGSAWVDESTLQLLRITIEAERIPSHVHVRSLRSEINYAMVQLGNSIVLLPRSSQYTLQHSTRVDLSSRIEFSGCRQYGVTSDLSFADPVPASGAGQNSIVGIPLPAGVILPIRLTAAIDSGTATATVGDTIAAVTTRNILVVGGPVFPAGTTVRGRIRKMERHLEPSRYIVVGLEFNELELGTQRIPFFAEMKDISPFAGMLAEAAVGLPMMRRILSSVPRIPGAAFFAVAGNRVQIPKGHAMTWETKELPAGPLKKSGQALLHCGLSPAGALLASLVHSPTSF